MCSRVDILEFLDAQLRANLHGGEQGVSGHLLNMSDARAVVQHQGGRGAQ